MLKSNAIVLEASMGNISKDCKDIRDKDIRDNKDTEIMPQLQQLPLFGPVNPQLANPQLVSPILNMLQNMTQHLK